MMTKKYLFYKMPLLLLPLFFPLINECIVGDYFVVISVVGLSLGVEEVGAPRVNALRFKRNIGSLYAHIAKAAADNNAKVVVLVTPMGDMAIATHPDMMRDVLKDEDTFPKVCNRSHYLAPLLDNSLLFADPVDWKHQRSVVSPAFHFDFLRGFLPMMLSKAHEVLDKFPLDEVFDAKAFLFFYALDVLGLTSFGIDFNALNGGSHEFYHSYMTLLTNSQHMIRNLIPVFLRETLPLPFLRKNKLAKFIVLSTIRSIKEKRKDIQEKKYLIDMLLDANPPISDSQFEHNMFLFFAAGHETTGTALSWELNFLAKHPEKQARLREEVDQVLKGENVTASHLKDLPYLDMFIKEALRYGSPVGLMVTRESSSDINIHGIFIPKNTTIALGIHSVHHNPEFWPSPEVFNPERFAPNQIAKQHPFAYLPFSLGKRVWFTISTTDKSERISPSFFAHSPEHVRVLLERRK